MPESAPTTELVFILDRSGSMSGLESDTIGGFNAMLAKQKEAPGVCRLTTVLFNHEVELLHDRLDLQAVQPLSDKEYYVRGNTAMLDAIGQTIAKIDGVQKHSAADCRADKVLFVITTDGQENASREYTYGQIKKLIEQHRQHHGWEFIFLGANIDVEEVVSQIGIPRGQGQGFHNDREGIALNARVVSEAVIQFRSAPAGTPLPADWNAAIQADLEKRQK